MHRLHKTPPVILPLFFITSLLAVLLCATPALAVPRVERYDPNTVDAGDRVRIEGRDFGSQKPQHSIRYGTNGTPAGNATIRSWSESAIEVDLPRSITPGRYWMAIYEREALRGNQLRALTVRGAAAGAPPIGGLSDKLRTTIPGAPVPRPGQDKLKGVPLQKRLTPSRTGTTWEQRFSENRDIYCGVRKSAIGGPLSGPGGGVVLVGYSNYHDPGTPPLACWKKNDFTYRGMVRFDMNADGGAPVEKAVLSLRVSPVPENDGDPGCDGQPIVNLIPLRENWSAGMRENHVSTGGAAFQIGSTSGGRISRDITRLAQQWQSDGDARNHGFALQGRNEQYEENNNRCVITASDFALQITYGRVE